ERVVDGKARRGVRGTRVGQPVRAAVADPADRDRLRLDDGRHERAAGRVRSGVSYARECRGGLGGRSHAYQQFGGVGGVGGYGLDEGFERGGDGGRGCRVGQRRGGDTVADDGDGRRAGHGQAHRVLVVVVARSDVARARDGAEVDLAVVGGGRPA